MEKPDIVRTMLEEGVDFTVEVAHPNLLHKLKICKPAQDFVIYPIKLGTLMKIARLLTGIRMDENNKNFLEAGIKAIAEHKDKMVAIIGLAIENRNREPSRKLIKFLNDNLDASEALKLLTVVIKQMDIQDFLAFMVSIQGMNLLETDSTPGESSEESSNTSDSQESKSSGDTPGQI